MVYWTGMAGTESRLLAACLRIVRLLTVVTALSVAVLIVLALLEKRSLRGPVQPVLAGPEGAPEAPPLPAPAAPPPLAPLDPKGTTRFVRRLEVGTEISRLQLDTRELGRRQANLEARLERARPFLLRADGVSRETACLHMLDVLADPPRDLGSLTLARATSLDPLGSGLRVRAWTVGDPYPEAELATVEATLDHIVRCVGHDIEGGIDALVTPAMGYDVFRLQPQPPISRAAGVYFVADQYCVVGSDLRPAFRVEVFEHELVHAYCHRTAKSFTKSRLIGEGIAEYLRLVAPGDYGLNVPAGRLKDPLAELAFALERLSAGGVNLKTVHPRRLVALDPDGFYHLGHLGYLLAQATMAYVGGDVILKALYRHTDKPIAEAIDAIEWREFLAFVERGGRHGRLGRAVIVDDADATSSAASRGGRAAFSDALREIGAEVPDLEQMPDPASTTGELAARLGAEKRIKEALRLLLAEPTEVRMFVDPSEAMDRRARLSTPAAALLDALGAQPEGETARQVAVRLADFLGVGPAWHVVALSEPPRLGGSDVLRAAHPLAFGGFLDRPPEEKRLAVLVFGSPGLAVSTPSAVPEAGRDLEVLLVVDLTPDGQAIHWARAFEAPGRRVAYWSPLAEEE